MRSRRFADCADAAMLNLAAIGGQDETLNCPDSNVHRMSMHADFSCERDYSGVMSASGLPIWLVGN
jgi:hypothetical protein